MTEEKTVRLQSKTNKPTYDLPAVQCKDTLLLDYDYSKQYSKRGLVNNWDKYAELRDDDDDDNGQLSAADFEQLLSASKSIGDHFTFAAERTWLQAVDNNQICPSEDNSMASDLFKLNMANLKNGISHIPFYKRLELSEDIFTNEEITNMNYRANFYEKNKINPKISTDNPINQNILTNILKSNLEQVKNKSENSKKAIDVSKKPPTDTELVKSLQNAQINDRPLVVKSPPTTSTLSNPLKLTAMSNKTSTVQSNKTEDIQDWLDDILNEG